MSSDVSELDKTREIVRTLWAGKTMFHRAMVIEEVCGGKRRANEICTRCGVDAMLYDASGLCDSFNPFASAADALMIRKRLLKTDNATVERFIDNLAALALEGYKPNFQSAGHSSEAMRASVWALAGENAPRMIAEAAWRTVAGK